eukprot:6171891-Pleurochrysis_carterae.AAC.1
MLFPRPRSLKLCKSHSMRGGIIRQSHSQRKLKRSCEEHFICAADAFRLFVAPARLQQRP